MAKKRASPTIDVLFDDREKKILPLEKCPEVASMERRRLNVGDYSTAALYDGRHCVIERKSLVDLCTSITKKTFLAELDRGREFAEVHLVCSCTLDQLLNYPYSAVMPQSVRRRIRATGKYVLKRILQLSRLYPNLSVWFADSEANAAKLVASLLKSAEESYLNTPADAPIEKESA